MLGMELKRGGGIPLSRQIYNSIRDRIVDGQLKPGEALPSTRELAAQLAVSRNTVCEAYDMLLAEAFTESRQGSPTRVAQGVQLGRSSCAKAAKNETDTGIKIVPGSGTRDSIHEGVGSTLYNFRTGLPDLTKFPIHQWLQLMYRSSEQLTLNQWGYSGPEGLAGLREEIAAWLFRSRGMSIDPEALFITAGATHALHLLSELLFPYTDSIIVEDPCHTGMLRVFKSRGFRIDPIPADEHGIVTGKLEGIKTKALYVTPSHQFPLGGILTAARRAVLIRYAQENGAYIIEDDYDSEFRYSGPPVAPLHAMATDRVIYVGTFSKILFPALRIGYVILPHELRERWRYLRIHTDVQNPPFEQASLAEYMHSRRFDRHIRQMRRLYGQRRQVLLQALADEFGTGFRIWGDAAGLHMAVEFPGKKFCRDFVLKCRENGVSIQTVNYYCINKDAHLDKLLMGYGHLSPEAILAGIFQLSKII